MILGSQEGAEPKFTPNFHDSLARFTPQWPLRDILNVMEVHGMRNGVYKHCFMFHFVLKWKHMFIHNTLTILTLLNFSFPFWLKFLVLPEKSVFQTLKTDAKQANTVKKTPWLKFYSVQLICTDWLASS